MTILNFQIGFTIIFVCQSFTQVYYSLTAYFGHYNNQQNWSIDYFDQNYSLPNEITFKSYAISYFGINHSLYYYNYSSYCCFTISKISTNNILIQLTNLNRFSKLKVLLIILNNTALSDKNSLFSQLTFHQFSYSYFINCGGYSCQLKQSSLNTQLKLLNNQKFGQDIRRQCILSSKLTINNGLYNNHMIHNNFYFYQNGIEIPLYHYQIRQNFNAEMNIKFLCMRNLKCPDTHPYRYKNSRFCGNCQKGTIVQGNNSLPDCLVEDQNFIQYKYYANNSVQQKCGRCVVSKIQQSLGINLAFIIIGPLAILLIVLAQNWFTKRFFNSHTIIKQQDFKIN